MKQGQGKYNLFNQKENILMKMVIAMKVNGTKKKNMDLEYIYIKLQVL